MTRIYFVRHCQSERFAQDDRTRPLTAGGMADAEKAAEVLLDKGITRIFSSPYTRTLQTISPLAARLNLPVVQVEELHERYAGSWHGENFLEFIEKQWADFDFHIQDGECLRDCQRRNIAALNGILAQSCGETAAVATHGTALSTIINHFRPEYGFRDFMRILDYMPYIIRMDFDGERYIGYEEIFHIEKEYK